jgi:hypothetical protein
VVWEGKKEQDGTDRRADNESQYGDSLSSTTDISLERQPESLLGGEDYLSEGHNG